jgi:signal transduction histidine kinase
MFRNHASTTFLRQAKCEMVARARELQVIFEALPDGLLVYDAEGRIVRSNPAARQLLGLESHPEFATLPWKERAAWYAMRNTEPERIPVADLALSRLLRGELLSGADTAEDYLHTFDGHDVSFSMTGRPLRDAEGTIIGAVGIARDVTQQRRLELQTHAALDALLAMAEALVQAPGELPAANFSEAQRASLEGDYSPLSVLARRLAELTRSLLGFQYVSIVAVEPATERLSPVTIVGFTPEQERRWWASWERPVGLSERLDPVLAARLRSGMSGLIEQREQSQRWHPLFADVTSLLVPMRIGETLVGVLRLEENGPNLDGTRVQETAVIEAVAELGALVLERERLLREREQARASELALRETQGEMDIFLSIAAHELKTPLTSLKLALQLGERRLRRLVEAEPDRAEALEPFQEQVAQVAHQTVRLDRLVNDLLDVARARVGRLDLHPELTDLAAIVEDAVEQQRQANPTRTLSFQLPADARVPITADPDRIGQVVTNYLTNALKYSAEDRPVAVGLDVEAEQARVWVRDQGPGVPAEEQELIWERFHRAKGIEVQSGSGVGLGLGLHICRMIIERHQGRVGIQSAPGKGSTLWFTLPLGSQKENQQPEPG